MRIFVIIATKGRAREMQFLLHSLKRQTRQPDYTIIIGTEEKDVEGLQSHALIASGRVETCISPKVGLTSQRNFGLNRLVQKGYFNPEAGAFFCAFFDDDYRLAADWLQRAHERFTKGGIVGLTGQILADGVKIGGLTEAQADAYLTGGKPAEPHWASGAEENDTRSVYGCNMAFADSVTRDVRFDEALPLYGWQEDRDYTGMARKIGRVIYYPDCKGVHLGVSSGRVSGRKFGYSQIANTLYLMKKGTMGRDIGIRFLYRAFLSNLLHSLINHPQVDYRGRLRGNLYALKDIFLLRLHPSHLPK